MRAVLFGGSGFIGMHLTESLIGRGFEVVIADLIPPTNRLPSGASYERCDVRRPISLEQRGPFDAIYNLAAIHRTPGHEPYEYYETNIYGAQNVTDWAGTRGRGGQYICFISSISVYGSNEEPQDESSSLSPSSDYGRSKVIAEKIHRRWQEAESGRRLIVTRPAVVFGPGEKGNFTRLANALAKRRFMYPGRKDVIKACGYVGELVHAIEFIEASEDDSVTFNFCYPQRYTTEQICEAFQEVAGYRLPWVVPKPLIASGIAALRAVDPTGRGAVAATRIGKLTTSTNVIPAELTGRGYEWRTDLTTGLRAWRQQLAGNHFA